MKIKFIADWRNKNLKCYFCGETRSVKFEKEIIDTTVDNKPRKVPVCNKCLLHNIFNNKKS